MRASWIKKEIYTFNNAWCHVPDRLEWARQQSHATVLLKFGSEVYEFCLFPVKIPHGVILPGACETKVDHNTENVKKM